MTTPRRGFVAAILSSAVFSMMARKASADGIQVIGNHGQIVSTGDVNVRQAAAGMQVMDGNGNWVTMQSVGNDLQIVSTGNVNADQSASGSQQITGGPYSNGGSCSPGEYVEEAGCVYFCLEDGCTWASHCCDLCKSCPKPKGKCCK